MKLAVMNSMAIGCIIFIPTLVFATPPILIPTDTQLVRSGVEFDDPAPKNPPLRQTLESMRASQAAPSAARLNAIKNQYTELIKAGSNAWQLAEEAKNIDKATPASSRLKNQTLRMKAITNLYLANYRAMIANASKLLGRTNSFFNLWGAHELWIELNTSPTQKKQRSLQKAAVLAESRKQIDAELARLKEGLKAAIRDKNMIIARRDEIENPLFEHLLNEIWKDIASLQKIIDELEKEGDYIDLLINDLTQGPLA